MIPRATAVVCVLLTLLGCQPANGPEASARIERVVTLAPHLAEIVWSLGAGDKLVGVSAWSDFPAPVADLPVVGDAFAVDQEQLAALSPDVVLAWASGTPQATVSGLRARGYRVEVIRSESLADIEQSYRTIGSLLDSETAGEDQAREFRATLQRLAGSGASRVRYFLQVSERPLYTINREHYLSEALSLCGGENVFADLDTLSASVSLEAVIARDPGVLISLGDVAALNHWRRWENLDAVAKNRLISLPGITAGRPTGRMLEPVAEACRYFDSVAPALTD